MSKKKLLIIISAVVLILTTTVAGVSFALWEGAPQEYSYTIGTEQFAIVNVEKLTLDTKSITPAGENAAVKTKSEIKLKVINYEMNLTFSVNNIEYLGLDGEWHAAPTDVLKIVFQDDKDQVITGVSKALIGVNNYYIIVGFDKDSTLVDDVFKNTKLRYDITINCVRAA